MRKGSQRSAVWMGRRLKNELQCSLHDVFDVYRNGGDVIFIALFFFAGEKRHLD